MATKKAAKGAKATKDTKGQAAKVEADHAKSGRPVSPTEDPTKHAVPASELAGQIDPTKKSGATVNAESMDKIQAKEEEKEQAQQAALDEGLPGKIKASGLFFVRDHSVGGDGYVGISPQNDPNATEASKNRSVVVPLTVHAPRTGMQIRPKDGDAFSVPDGFGLDTTPADWGRVMSPDGKPLFG
jgi:hypothetical protein